MTALGSLLFNCAFFAWGIFFHLICLPVLLMPRSITIRAGRFWVDSSFALLRLLCRLDFRVVGGKNLPEGGCIFASKHQSAWDTFVFFLVLNDPCFVLKHELLKVPLFGWYLGKAGMISVDRAGGAAALRGMIERAKAALEAGRPIVVFPEGTRTAPGTRRPYQSGVAALAKHLGAPTVPVALNSGLFWGRRSFFKYPGTITLEFLPAIPPPSDRKAYLATLEERIEAASTRLLNAAREQSRNNGLT